jgi:hypothetical protein
LAKAAFPPSLETMIGGLKYGIYTLFWSPWIGLFTGIAAIGVALFLFNRTKSKEKNLQVPLLVAFAAIQTMFIIFSGGDWMEGGRFFVPIVPVLAILVALAVEASIQRKTRRMVMGSVLICLQLGLTAKFVVAKSTGLPILSAIKCYRSFGADLEIGEYKWFERTNQVHLRDIGILYHLDRLIPQIRRKSPRVCILTGAMGMVPYHLAKRYGSNDFYFMDIYALTDRNFTTCPITSSLPRASMGLQLSLKGFLALWPALSRECRIPEPDVILGTYRDQEDLDLYEDYGYRMIFLQDEYARDVIPRPLLRPQFKMFLAVHHRHDLSPISGR